MCAGGTFLKNTGSKSNTLIASEGLAMRGAFASRTGSFEGRSTPPSAKPGEPSSGLADSHRSRRRRFSDRSLKDVMEFPPLSGASLRAAFIGEPSYSRVAVRLSGVEIQQKSHCASTLIWQ